jgi:hypothetical protein
MLSRGGQWGLRLTELQPRCTQDCAPEKRNPRLASDAAVMKDPHCVPASVSYCQRHAKKPRFFVFRCLGIEHSAVREYDGIVQEDLRHDKGPAQLSVTMRAHADW